MGWHGAGGRGDYIFESFLVYYGWGWMGGWGGGGWTDCVLLFFDTHSHILSLTDVFLFYFVWWRGVGKGGGKGGGGVPNHEGWMDGWMEMRLI